MHKFYLEYMSTKEEKEINKIALSSNDDKRLQTCDTITSYPYGTSAVKVCEARATRTSKFKMINFDD